MRMEEKVIEKLPKVYKRNGKECYLEPIREKLIYITPKETVRQKVIIHLTENLQVPIEKITAKQYLANYGVKSNMRVDLVIHSANEEELIPIAE